MFRKCSATSKRTGKPCAHGAIYGGTVCKWHGGNAPQVKRKAAERLALAGITRDRTLLEIGRIAYGDLATFFRDDGTIKAFSELNVDQRAMLAGYEVVIGNVAGGDGKQDMIHKVKTWNKNQALELLARHFKLIGDDKTEAVETLAATIQQAMIEGRERARLRLIETTEIRDVTPQPVVVSQPTEEPNAITSIESTEVE